MQFKIIPHFRSMIWGNSDINVIFELENEMPIGEIWLLSGHPLYETKLENGISLNEFGRSIYDSKYERFPILIKLVSTKQWLSVQVHPDNDYANSFEKEPWGKSEAWYFLTDGEFAICEDVDKMKEYINNGKMDKLNEVMTFVKVRKGTFVNIPAGTVHALGPNSTVIEVQQSSDLTYRIYDWGRPRETHIEKAIQVSKSIKISDILSENTAGLQTPYFTFSTTLPEKDSLIVEIPTEITKDFCAKIILKETVDNQSDKIYVYNFL
ncbi:class I mannose-6-phosphate isomerase [Fervidobacterium riparium]|uniref:Mannose-6-phosphate isomerase, type 1 n=1 Tax=Fervidobacterium gondwanense DSM 13020 TaxID=1121883 RepID=A0A1M7SV63_FERGO|nr:type I phosphomannose isomerase catalytic subunit [Fervidobacterium gondwanense]UXF00519.1 mannose-6-phosphate isomerase [Fervidobacterium riparium]SHN62443.1 mannose-6-phosphate isomerase, type 1 [Fervidobacterium gondwanense DSM 13020]